MKDLSQLVRLWADCSVKDYSSCASAQWSFRKLTTMGTPKLSAEGAKFEAPSIERRRRENRSAEGAERGRVWEGCPLPSRLGSLGERRKLPQRGPGQSILPYFRVKKTSFWTAKCIL